MVVVTTYLVRNVDLQTLRIDCHQIQIKEPVNVSTQKYAVIQIVAST